jgi:hypothetical protein
MKIKINGIATRDEIVKAIDKTIEFLGVDFEKHCLNGINIYFNVYEKNGDKIVFTDTYGDEIDFMQFSTCSKPDGGKRRVCAVCQRLRPEEQ